MIPTTRAVLVCVVFLCRLEEVVLHRRAHCAGNRCVVVLQEPEDFAGARENCKKWGAQLLVVSLEQAKTTLSGPLSGLSGSYWLGPRGIGGTVEKEDAAGPRNCPSISLSAEGNLAMSWKPCSDRLNGFVCEHILEDHCSRLQAGGGAQVRYTIHGDFEIKDVVMITTGTIAVAERVGGKYPDSKHLCASGTWLKAPWNCEVMRGGCEQDCNSTTNACACLKDEALHPNNITCHGSCAHCAQGCQREGDSYVCECKSGYRLARDRKSCVDVNECEEEDPCAGEGEECLNKPGGYECRCSDGFVEEDGACVDVSICEKCEHMKCENPTGVYRCECRDGFRVSAKDPTKCEQYCAKKDCLAECIPNKDVKKRDMHQCFCPDGYIKDIKDNTTICTDIDECVQEKPCDHTCINLFGGYRCSCNEGFELKDGYKCVREEWVDGSGSTTVYDAPPSAQPAVVPPYVKTGSVLGITLFVALFAAFLCLVVRNMLKRCRKFELPTFSHSDIDIFHLQQVTTDRYKRLSFDKQFKNELPRP